MSYIFLSHSHVDKPFARRLAADLRAAGHAVWIDEAEINVGDSLIGAIREGLDQVDYVAALLSTASVESEWVRKELDIASNREVDEKRVVVLPLMIEKVPLPGFLKGKFYADFTSPEKYAESFPLLLKKLGPAVAVPAVGDNELRMLREQLKAAQEEIAVHKSAVETHRRMALKGKTARLIAAIEKADKEYPEHSPINATYAFEVAGIPVTLDYLVWAVAKAQRTGAHSLGALLTIEEKWSQAEAMIAAYAEMVERANR